MVHDVESYLTFEEGRRSIAYKDTKGLWTNGIGHLIQPGEEWMKDTILNNDQIDDIFASDMKAATLGAAGTINNYYGLDQVRQAAIIGMVFQLGLAGFKAFHDAITAIERSDYQAASDAMLDSKWAKIDTPQRAKRAALMMTSGEWPNV